MVSTRDVLLEIQDKLQIMARHHDSMKIGPILGRSGDVVPWLQAINYLVDYLPTIDEALNGLCINCSGTRMAAAIRECGCPDYDAPAEPCPTCSEK